MRTRYFTLGTLVTTLVVFVWQTLSNTVFFWHTLTMHPFQDNAVAAQTLRSVAPVNGVYFAPQGILAAVSLTANGQPKSMGPMLGTQLVLDLVVVAVLAWALLRLPSARPVRTGVTTGALGLAAALVLAMSDWNWYGFAFGYSLVNVVDIAVQLFIAGFLLERFRRKYVTEAAAASAPPAVAMQGGLPSLRSGATTRP